MVNVGEMMTMTAVFSTDTPIQKTCREDIRCIAVGDPKSGKNQLLSACEKIDSNKQQAVFLEYSTCRLYNDINHILVFKGFSGEYSKTHPHCEVLTTCLRWLETPPIFCRNL